MAEPRQGGFDMSRLTMGQRGLLIAGGLMFIDLFLPWNRVCVGADPFRVCGSASGWGGGMGMILGLLVVALLVWEGLQLAGVNTNLNVNAGVVSAALAGGVVLFTLLKVLIDNEFFAIGGWIGIILALAIGYFGWIRYNESKTATAAPPAPPVV